MASVNVERVSEIGQVSAGRWSVERRLPVRFLGALRL